MNKGLLFEQSGAGPVETVLPVGAHCPLPHYLLFTWRLRESWYCSVHRLGWGLAGLGSARERAVTYAAP